MKKKSNRGISMRWLAGLLAALVSVTSVFAEAKIEEKHRIFNKTNQQCVWCCLQTLGNAHEIKELYNLVDEHKTAPKIHEVEEFLDSRHIHYSMQRLVKNTKILKTACDFGWGCMVYVYNNPRVVNGRTTTHAIVLVDFNDKEVKFIDNCDKDLKVQSEPTKRFLARWTGTAYVVWNLDKVKK